MNRSRTALALALVGPLLLLGACSEDPQPKMAPGETPSRSASPSPTPSAGLAVPRLPSAATKRTDAGAEAFVRYFISVLNFAQASGDTRMLKAVSAQRCSACFGYIEAINDAYGSGGKVKGGVVSIGHLRELPADYGGDWGAYGKGHSSRQVIVDSEGRRAFPAGKVALYAYTRWVRDHWEMQWIRTPT